MVKTALADDILLKYLSNVAKQFNCAIGLILGQYCAGKYYIAHFAKTPPFQNVEDRKEGKASKPIRNITEISENWIAEHARHATRMLPGGMCVLGIFVVSEEQVLSPFNVKLKTILSVMHKQLSTNKYLYGSTETEKLILHFTPKSQNYSCKTYDVASLSVQPAEVKFSQKSKWSCLECKYGIDELYYLTKETDLNLGKHIEVMLESIKYGLDSSIFLFDGELKDEDESLEHIGKKEKVPRGKNKSNHQEGQDTKPIQLSIFQLSNSKQENNKFETHDVVGNIKVVGEVASKLWLNPKITIGDSTQAIVQDIMRSLATRFEMHWDSLTEEEHSEDVNTVHEPPRRVLIAIPESNIALSDYLFPGEGPEDAKNSLEEMLDVKIHNELDIQEVEGQADITQYCSEPLETSESDEIFQKLPGDANKFMYIVGISVAILVLIVSLLIHFYKQ